jgi:hypothetical protein
MDWNDPDHDRENWRTFVNTVMNLGVSKYVTNFLTGLGTISSSRRILLHVFN